MTQPYWIQCEGWWEQDGYGRQPMNELRVVISNGRVQGSGDDVVGPFTFQGTIDENGEAALLKRYIGQHIVDYFGRYDGEGVLSGHWHVGGLTGVWLIRLRDVEGGVSNNAIQDYFPDDRRD